MQQEQLSSFEAFMTSWVNAKDALRALATTLRLGHFSQAVDDAETAHAAVVNMRHSLSLCASGGAQHLFEMLKEYGRDLTDDYIEDVTDGSPSTQKSGPLSLLTMSRLLRNAFDGVEPRNMS